EEAVTGADIVVLITEWPEFTALDPDTVGSLVAQRVVIDGRNALDADAWKTAGWRYRGLGR
ncbi:UDP-glucose/GDP-mannose dehydrogenase family protein, partial [Leifsonia sp. TF02-11]|uniref:UDP-glucose/GDP-mannose dehydrogenase family protein n=1 Tax=Leifsonia sp. TF02-11 TaxID=2815212 RepID=UPI001ACCCD54